MIKIKYISLVYLFLMVLSSCNKETHRSSQIEAELIEHFNEFSIQANNYGIYVDFDVLNINAYIENIQSIGTVGQCKIYSDDSKEVILDVNYWQNSDFYSKEALVFHELGHCVLGRSHNETKDQHGICLSLMQSGESSCIMRYDAETREAYILELFSN